MSTATPTVVIDKGIPIPTGYQRKGQSSKYDFLNKMSVRDSVELTIHKSPSKGAKVNGHTYAGLIGAIYRTSKINPNTISGRHKKFITRTMRYEHSSKGVRRIVRVWRTV